MREVCDRMSRNAQVLIQVQRNQYSWYILCRTLESVESLRVLCDSGELTEMLENIFNCLSPNSDKMMLNITWSNADYENCKLFMASGRPFDSVGGTEDTVVFSVYLQVCCCGTIVRIQQYLLL